VKLEFKVISITDYAILDVDSVFGGCRHFRILMSSFGGYRTEWNSNSEIVNFVNRKFGLAL
jgi:hypothetical protein